MKKKLTQYRAVGRRKSSIAQVILSEGTGRIMMNDVTANDFLPYASLVQTLKESLVLTGNEKSFDIKIKVKGGGFTGQTGAASLGISRALLKVSLEYRTLLKGAGLLTCDARKKERKKYGLHKARKAKQFSKR